MYKDVSRTGIVSVSLIIYGFHDHCSDNITEVPTVSLDFRYISTIKKIHD